MLRTLLRIPTLIAAVVLALCARTAVASTIQDLVRPLGQQSETVTGLGIVVGLNGTGDSAKDSPYAARAYAELQKNLGLPVLSPRELEKDRSWALVTVTMTIPAAGARSGDEFDVEIAAAAGAESIVGGRLFPSLLRLPLPDSLKLRPLAVAEGMIEPQGTNPNIGIIRQGGSMLVDAPTSAVAPDGRVTLVLREPFASYHVATMLADTINDVFATREGATGLAIAEDAKTIHVTMPGPSRRNPAAFVAQLMTIYIDSSLLRLPARVVINEREGVIIATDSVEIDPVAITHSGLSITTLTPEPQPAPDNPVIEVDRWTGMTTEDRPGRGATRLNDLIAALNRLNVPVADQIEIIHSISRSGALRGELVIR